MPGVAQRGGGRRSRRTINEINMVPFIDVMLVLLIIFMVTAPLITPSTVDLPSVGKAARQPDQVIQVVIGPDGRIEVKADGLVSATSVDDVAGLVKRLQTPASGDKSSAVVISADKHVEYEKVVRVMDKLQRAGIARVGLSVQLAK